MAVIIIGTHAVPKFKGGNLRKLCLKLILKEILNFFFSLNRKFSTLVKFSTYVLGFKILLKMT